MRFPFEVFSLTGDELLREGHFWSLMFLVLAVVTASTMFFQATFYGIAAEKLTLRLRSKVHIVFVLARTT